MDGVGRRAGTRYVVPSFLAVLLLCPPAAPGQTPPWREAFTAGEDARARGDIAAYQRMMAEAARAMPEGHLSRPFVQYHAARAAALAGMGQEAVRWLRTAWEEDIEALMITFAAADPAFDALREDPALESTLALPERMALGARLVGDAAWLLTGAGANLLVVVGGAETLLVDTGYGPALGAVRRSLQELAVRGPTHVLVTHPHQDHMGSAGELGAESTVLAHPGTAAAMAAPYVFIEGVELPPKPRSALPDVEIDSDTTVRIGAREVRVVPLAAHTGADLAVYVPSARVAHLGDAYLPAEPMMFPGADEPDAFLDRFERFLDAMAEGTVVIPGHGEPGTVDDVRRQIVETRACMELVRGALAEGLDAEATARRAEGRFPPQWVGFFHRALGSR